MRLNTAETNIPKHESTGSEDTTLVREDLGLFGVFDGMGGPGDGDIASQLASNTVKDFYERESGSKQKNLHEAGHTAREALMHAQEALQERASDDSGVSADMGTTATIARIFSRDNAIYVAYAHVGDSGLLVLHRDGHLKFITREEAEQNVLHNVLSARGKAMQGVQQYGVLEVEPGDRLVFFSDGISGDTEEQWLSESEWLEAVNMDDPQAAAGRLVEVSRKTDDRAVVVVDVLG